MLNTRWKNSALGSGLISEGRLRGTDYWLLATCLRPGFAKGSADPGGQTGS